LVTPSAGATVTVTARYGPLRTAAPGPIDVVVGAAQISVTLSTGAPMWRVSAGLGGPGEPGLEAKVDIGSMLGALGSIVNIAALDEAYSPAVTVTAGGAPVFELGHSGNG
jgi:hypothetical protein